jgi:hypothetical protein
MSCELLAVRFKGFHFTYIALPDCILFSIELPVFDSYGAVVLSKNCVCYQGVARTPPDVTGQVNPFLPSTIFQTPNSKLQTPNSKLQTPNSKLQTPNSKPT